MTKSEREKPSDVAEIIAALTAINLRYPKIYFNRHGNLAVKVRRHGQAVTMRVDPRPS
jgi:hypothetical protein